MTGELISRETAIQTVHETMYQFIDDSEIMTGRDGLLLKANKAICNGLKEIPSVENKGEWLGLDSDAVRYDDIMCSNCKQHFTVDAHRWCDIGFTVDDLKFCPNCGADMRGE